jgi:TrkA domain protein
MPQINETDLPGIGTRYDFGCRSGRRIGVVARPSGRREIVVYATGDPDAVAAAVDLGPEESEALATLLGATTLAHQVEHLDDGIIPGLAIDWVPVPSTAATRTIGDLEVRTRTGASIVAIVHQDEPLPAPGPDAPIRAGDTVVIVGTPEGITATTRLLEDS